MREVVTFDAAQISWRRGLVGTCALLILVAFLGWLGAVVIAAALAAVFVLAGAPKERTPDLLLVAVVVFGTLVTGVISLAAESALWAAIVIGIVTFAATAMALFGKRSALTGLFGILWAIVALAVGTTPDIAVSMSVAFAVGGATALVALWASSRVKAGRSAAAVDDTADDADAAEAADAAEPVDPRSDLVLLWLFAGLRALGAAVCVYLGYKLFPAHDAWAALAFVLVLRPPARQVYATGVNRAIGTGLGVAVGGGLLLLLPDSQIAGVIVFLAAALFLLAVGKANPVLSTALTALLIVAASDIATGQAQEAASQRFWATLLGVGLAFGVLAALVLFRRIAPHEPRSVAASA